MRILITRPAEDAAAFAARLARCGVESLVVPLMSVRPEPGLRIDLAGVRAVLLTSANGARALADATTTRAVPVIAVGPATAAAACEAGFAEVAVSGGDVEALAATVVATIRPEEGALLHVAGSVVAGDLAGRLGTAGYDLRRVVAYRAEPATDLPDDITAALVDGMLDGAAFFSPRSAATFGRLVERAALGGTLRGLTGYCLSEAVAGVLAGAAWGSLRVASSPDGEALAALICAEARVA